MKVDFTKTFLKQYDKQPSKIQNQFIARLTLFKKDQFHQLLNNHALSGKYQGFRSININGDYRALYKLQDNRLIIFAYIGSHSQLYK